MISISTKPYMIRALHQWCGDNSFTPYLSVWVNGQVTVPMQYVEDNKIVLNIGHNATQGLRMENDWISFSARFGGVSNEIWIPVTHVLSIFARETGEGMGFEVDIEQLSCVPAPSDDEPPPPRTGGGRPQLKIVK